MRMSMRLNGARAICQSLVKEGVSTIFGLPGGAIMPLYDVLPEFPALKHILVRHEQCAGHMADGYARAAAAIRKPQEQRTVGVCFGTSGPGATNLVTGICNAHMDSVPLVAITANVPNSMIGTDAFQEADITGITIPITKQNYFVRNGKDLPRVIREAFHLARTGRPGPVHVDVPKDVLLTEHEWTGYPSTVDLPGYQPTLEPNMRQVKEAARLIERAQRPVTIVGDVARVLGKLEPEVDAAALQNHEAWLEQIRGWREQYPPKCYPSDTAELYQPQVIQAIDRATRGEAIIVADVGQHQMFAAQHYQYTAPYTYITSGGLGTMGYSLPAAIGAQMARPDKQVWCVVGDGCFQMTLQELAVIAVHRVPVKIALLNNEYLGMVRQQQQVQYRGNIVEVDLAGGPDYIKLAQAYGVPAWRVSEASQLDDTVGAAMAYPGPAIIEFRVARTEDVYPWVLGGTSLGDVIADTPYEPPRERVLVGTGPSPKDGSDR